MSPKSPENSYESWSHLAECRGYPREIFFPEDGAGVKIAKNVCSGCVVIDNCLEFALDTNQTHGVWGGTSERERARIQKARRTTTPIK